MGTPASRLGAATFVTDRSGTPSTAPGEPSERLQEAPGGDADPWRFWPPALLAALVLLFGFWTPRPLLDAVRDAAAVLELR